MANTKFKYLLNTKWLTVREDHVRMPSCVEMEDYVVLEYPDWVKYSHYRG